MSIGGPQAVIELWISLSTTSSTASSTLACQGSQQVHIVLTDAPIGLTQFLHPLAGMQYGGVVPAAEGIAHFRQAMIGKFLRERHGYLPRSRDGTAAPLR